MAKKVKKAKTAKKLKKAKKIAKTAKTKKTATTKKAKKIARSTGSRTVLLKAGKPVTPDMLRTAAATPGPSDEELDLRNRLKAGPRRQAGPPLTGDTLRTAAMNALREEVVPAPTDPKEP